MNDVMEAARVLQDQQARIRGRDGYEAVATLLSATTDMDGSAHLVYSNVVWSSAGSVDRDINCYSEGDTLVSIEPERLHA